MIFDFDIVSSVFGLLYFVPLLPSRITASDDIWARSVLFGDRASQNRHCSVISVVIGKPPPPPHTHLPGIARVSTTVVWPQPHHQQHVV